jgi:hypothetical protein
MAKRLYQLKPCLSSEADLERNTLAALAHWAREVMQLISGNAEASHR